MLILADENIPLLEPFFEGMGRIERVPGRGLDPARAREADVLLVRSVTRVDRALLAGGRTRFVASATIGTDHIDRDYLAERGIAFANAPGCNADSVVDYVLAVLFNLAAERQQPLMQKTVGIVGVGNVGGRLQRRLQALGIDCLLNDPPRAAREGGAFVELEALLARCDVLCLHTPLTRDGSWPTHHLFDADRLAALRPGTWLVNAGRGAVIDNGALSALLDRRPDLEVVLDVWESEPGFDAGLAPKLRLGTPHIAGYSLEGRCRGTEMIYQALCRFLGRSAERSLAALLPPPAVGAVRVDAAGEELPRRLINLCYDPRDDGARFAAILPLAAEARARAFDQLRKGYPPRREFSSLTVTGLAPEGELACRLAAIGFGVAR